MEFPGRVWRVPLAGGRPNLVWRNSAVVALAFEQDPNHPRTLAVADRFGRVLLQNDEMAVRLRVEGEPVGVGVQHGQVTIITREGALWSGDANGLQRMTDRICCEDVVGAAFHPNSPEALIGCASHCSAIVWWSNGASSRAIPGVGSDQQAMSISPDRAHYTTGVGGNSEGLLIWDAHRDHPIASVPSGSTRSVVWSPSSEQLLTVGRDGTVVLWSLSRLRQRHPL